MTLAWTRIFSQLKWLVNKLKTFSVKSNNASSDNITNEISFNEDDDIAPNHNEDKIDDGAPHIRSHFLSGSGFWRQLAAGAAPATGERQPSQRDALTPESGLDWEFVGLR